jgi:Desulfoferrodoxin
MKFYKSKDDHFFIQLDEEEFQDHDIEAICEKNHNGDDHKHQPIVSIENNQVKVKIGDVMHPMTLEHHISLIFLKTKQGGQYKILNHQQTPIVTFELSQDDEAIEVYGYCNLHGLWKEIC